MATRIETIILRARDTLADQGKKRYSDDRLLRLVSEGHQDIVKFAKLLRGEYNLTPVPGQAQYKLPDYIWQITRAYAFGKPLSINTYDDFDNSLVMACNWQERTDKTIQALVHDRMNMSNIRLYPIPNEELADEVFDFTPDFGVITDFGGATLSSVFGLVTNIEDTEQEVTMTSPYGIVTDIEGTIYPILLYFFRTAESLTSVNDSLLTPPMFDTALKYYVVANALMDDLDISNRNMGKEQLQLYERELMLAQKTSAVNNVVNNRRNTTYKTPFSN